MISKRSVPLFPSSKNDFWPFLKLQKMKFGQKKFSEIDLFDFTSFFGLDIFKFSGPLCDILRVVNGVVKGLENSVQKSQNLFLISLL